MAVSGSQRRRSFDGRLRGPRKWWGACSAAREARHRAETDRATSDAFALSALFVALGIVGDLPGGLLYASKGISQGR